MNRFAIAPLLSTITFSTLGLYCYLKNIKSKTNLTFALICLTTSIWQGSLTILFSFKNPAPNTIMLLVRTAYSGIIFIPIVFYHFTIEFLNRKKEKIFVWVSYGLGILFLISLWMSTLFIRGYYTYPWGYYPKASLILHPLYFLMLSCHALRILYLFYKNVKRSQISTPKKQAKFMFWAIFFYAFASIDFTDNYGAGFYPFGFIFILISLSFMCYTIVKHRLLDINIIFRKTLGYSILIAILFIISVLVLFLLSYMFGQLFPQQKLLPTLFLIFILAIIFQPLYRWSTGLVDKLFFKGTLPQIAEELQRSERIAALGVMASGLAHEIKNPLVPIKTYIQNLKYNINNPEFIDKITKAIPQEVDKITDLLTQLRDFAQPPPLKLTEVNLHKVIDKKLSFIEQDLSIKNITIERNYFSSLIKLHADPIQLERVFLNLFLNAIDAMPNGGKLTITTEITSDNMALIKISDTGIGIAKEDLPHIFDPFFSKGKHHGSGLGLAITHRIIKEHNGKIQAISNLNKGTTFYICLFKI